MTTKTIFSITALVAGFIALQSINSANAEGLEVELLPADLGVERTIDPEILVDAPILLPSPITCKAAKSLVKDAGYKHVKRIECNGPVYTFKAKKNGNKLVVAINAITKHIWVI
jgi:hypothetical protein